MKKSLLKKSLLALGTTSIVVSTTIGIISCGTSKHHSSKSSDSSTSETENQKNSFKALKQKQLEMIDGHDVLSAQEKEEYAQKFSDSKTQSELDNIAKNLYDLLLLKTDQSQVETEVDAYLSLPANEKKELKNQIEDAKTQEDIIDIKNSIVLDLKTKIVKNIEDSGDLTAEQKTSFNTQVSHAKTLEDIGEVQKSIDQTVLNKIKDDAIKHLRDTALEDSFKNIFINQIHTVETKEEVAKILKEVKDEIFRKTRDLGKQTVEGYDKLTQKEQMDISKQISATDSLETLQDVLHKAFFDQTKRSALALIKTLPSLSLEDVTKFTKEFNDKNTTAEQIIEGMEELKKAAKEDFRKNNLDKIDSYGLKESEKVDLRNKLKAAKTVDAMEIAVATTLLEQSKEKEKNLIDNDGFGKLEINQKESLKTKLGEANSQTEINKIIYEAQVDEAKNDAHHKIIQDYSNLPKEVMNLHLSWLDGMQTKEGVDGFLDDFKSFYLGWTKINTIKKISQLGNLDATKISGWEKQVDEATDTKEIDRILEKAKLDDEKAATIKTIKSYEDLSIEEQSILITKVDAVKSADEVKDAAVDALFNENHNHALTVINGYTLSPSDSTQFLSELKAATTTMQIDKIIERLKMHVFTQYKDKAIQDIKNEDLLKNERQEWTDKINAAIDVNAIDQIKTRLLAHVLTLNKEQGIAEVQKNNILSAEQQEHLVSIINKAKTKEEIENIVKTSKSFALDQFKINSILYIQTQTNFDETTQKMWVDKINAIEDIDALNVLMTSEPLSATEAEINGEFLNSEKDNDYIVSDALTASTLDSSPENIESLDVTIKDGIKIHVTGLDIPREHINHFTDDEKAIIAQKVMDSPLTHVDREWDSKKPNMVGTIPEQKYIPAQAYVPKQDYIPAILAKPEIKEHLKFTVPTMQGIDKSMEFNNIHHDIYHLTAYEKRILIKQIFPFQSFMQGKAGGYQCINYLSDTVPSDSIFGNSLMPSIKLVPDDGSPVILNPDLYRAYPEISNIIRELHASLKDSTKGYFMHYSGLEGWHLHSNQSPEDEDRASELMWELEKKLFPNLEDFLYKWSKIVGTIPAVPGRAEVAAHVAVPYHAAIEAHPEIPGYNNCLTVNGFETNIRIGSSQNLGTTGGKELYNFLVTSVSSPSETEYSIVENTIPDFAGIKVNTISKISPISDYFKEKDYYIPLTDEQKYSSGAISVLLSYIQTHLDTINKDSSTNSAIQAIEEVINTFSSVHNKFDFEAKLDKFKNDYKILQIDFESLKVKVENMIVSKVLLAVGSSKFNLYNKWFSMIGDQETIDNLKKLFSGQLSTVIIPELQYQEYVINVKDRETLKDVKIFLPKKTIPVISEAEKLSFIDVTDHQKISGVLTDIKTYEFKIRNPNKAVPKNITLDDIVFPALPKDTYISDFRVIKNNDNDNYAVVLLQIIQGNIKNIVPITLRYELSRNEVKTQSSDDIYSVM